MDNEQTTPTPIYTKPTEDQKNAGWVTRGQVIELIAKLEARVDSQEAHLAQLTMAYTEMWAISETIVGQFLGERSEEEHKEFKEAVTEFRMNMWKEMNEIARNTSISDDLASSLEKLVGEGPDSPTS